MRGHHVFALVAFLLLAYAATGTVDYEVQKAIEEERAEIRAEPRPNNFAPVTDPIKPPRCPRVNAAGEPLRYSVATQADGAEWIHDCQYGIQT